MSYVLISVGGILCLLSYRWDAYYMANPNYYRLKGHSEVAEFVFEIISTVAFFGGSALIVFSGGLRLSRIALNIGIVLLLHFVLFPVLAPLIGRRRRPSQTERTVHSDTGEAP